MRKYALFLTVLALAFLVAVGGYFVWSQREVASTAPAPIAAIRAAPQVVPPPAEPSVKYPLPELASARQEPLPGPGGMDAFISAMLTELLGSSAVQSMLQTDDFVRRVVVTVDNLGREHAAKMLWPVNPTPGRFLVDEGKQLAFINPGNSKRYLPFVKLIESVDLDRAMVLYVRLYPALQRAYEELGYPGRYFNDRVVEVVDSMLAAPAPIGAVEVRITEVKGPVKPSLPWLHYDFVDGDLQKMPAGQKIMVRIGPENEKRIKARLRELRRLLTSKEPPRNEAMGVSGKASAAR